MTGYFIRRLLLIPPTLIGVTFIVFLITRAVPGGPIDQMIAQANAAAAMGGGSTMGQDNNLSERQMKRLKQQFYLDKPWYAAYPLWLWDVARGKLGNSFRYQRPVVDVIGQRLPISIYYGIFTLIITYFIAVPLGVYKAVRHQSTFDSVSSIFVFVGYAIPSYVLGVLLWYFFAARLEWFPTAGFVSENHDELGFFGKLGDVLHHSVLPLTCYIVGSFAFVTFLMKNHLMESLSADYVRTAVAKGASFRQAVWKHAFRNSLIPLSTNLGHQVAVLITGSFLIETIFVIEGFGKLGFESVVHRDFPVVMAITLISATLMLLGNILSDVLVAISDPRVSFK